MLATLLTTENLIALVTLTALEIVLGIDNIVFIAILTGKLPPEQADKARRIGLTLAMLLRILLLLSLSWIMGLTAELFTLPVLDHPVTGRDIVLLVGGVFLIGKATLEIHHKLEHAQPAHDADAPAGPRASFGSILVQLLLLDLVFSLDSVITAVGMARAVPVMIAAVVIAVGVMLVFAKTVSAFIERHPTLKVLALSFLLLIGVMLTVEGCGQHVNKGYIYFAMGFSLFVEVINIRAHRKPAASAAPSA